MSIRLKNLALYILRRRYAYNVHSKELKEKFVNKILLNQRKRDRVRRWGHGIGIASVLTGWPLILIGLPTMILFIVGSCRYSNLKDDLSNDGYPTNLNQLNTFKDFKDNALYAISEIKKVDNKYVINSENAKKILLHNEINFNIKNADESLNFKEQYLKLNALNEFFIKKAKKAISDQNAEQFGQAIIALVKIKKWMQEIPDSSFLAKNDLISLIKDANKINLIDKLNNDRLLCLLSITTEFEKQLKFTLERNIILKYLNDEEKRKEIEFIYPPKYGRIDNLNTLGYIYARTPFYYFTKYNRLKISIKLINEISKDFYQINPKILQDYAKCNLLWEKTNIQKYLENYAKNLVLPLRQIRLLLAKHIINRKNLDSKDLSIPIYLKNPLNGNTLQID